VGKKPSFKVKCKCLKAILTSDGCTGVPDFNFKQCCEKHDFYYRNITNVTRIQADRKLRDCIKEKWKLPVLPWVYFLGVRLVGWWAWRKKYKSKGS